MLNRTAVIEQITGAVDLLSPQSHDSIAVLIRAWRTLMYNKTIAQKFQQAHSARHDLTSWDVVTPAVQSYEPLTRYIIVAVDGSQIYPDRHQGVDCFLLNISRVVIPYDMPDGQVVLTSCPLLQVQKNEPTMHMHTERINAVRSVHEFETLYQAAIAVQGEQPDVGCVLALLDGPVGFWSLGSGLDAQQALRARYMAVCRQLYEQRVLHAGYISMPRATDIVRCLRRFHDGNNPHALCSEQRCIDTDLLTTILEPSQATRWFSSATPGVADYPAHVRPYFCYLHVGPEIGRVEVPAWIAADSVYSVQVLQGVLSQAHKGRGYPIALAEAHEQAVIKGADREFFYQALHRITRGSGVRPSASQKLLRKRYL